MVIALESNDFNDLGWLPNTGLHGKSALDDKIPFEAGLHPLTGASGGRWVISLFRQNRGEWIEN